MDRAFLVAAAKAAGPTGSNLLTPGILRFTLEYRKAPDAAAERERLRSLLKSDGFEFFRLPPGEDPLIHVLQFPGVPRQQSAGFLFEVAQDLTDALKLKSCVPDVDPGWIAGDELDRADPETVGGIVWALCKSDATPPTKKTWAIGAIRADAAWAKFDTRGEGIVIGQPDTGVADHRELDGAVDLAKGIDILAGGGKPIDPLASSMSNPGHGTATSSSAVSRTSLRIAGSAPGATLVPIRCVNAVVIGSGAAVASAIDHARLAKCDVVTMSLGGPMEGADLRRAIERAVKAGMIVLAAAGNCVPFVVYPAWDANVIAVAGTDENDRPWKGSSRGAKVDIAAPGENVYIARRDKPSDMDKSLVEPGQGTSFAVALTAGCAALWLARFKPAEVRKEAKKRGTTVQELFRAALRKTARKPAGWSTRTMGAGIVDAEKLLGLALADIPEQAKPASGNPGAAILESVPNAPRFTAEAGYLAADRAQRAIPRRLGALEGAVAPTPSTALAAALRKSPKGWIYLGAARSVVASPLTPYIGPENALRFLAEQAPGTTEHSGGLSEAKVRSYLEGVGRTEVLDRFEARLNRYDAGKDASPEVTALRREVLSRAEEVASGFARGARSSADFEGTARVTAEALVKLTGRPALRIKDGMIDPADPQLDAWAGDLGPARGALRPLVDAVGRIDVEIDGTFQHVGTGSVIGKGLIMTNRHVLEVFAEPMPSRGGKQKFLLNRPVSICFDEQAKDPQRRFKIKSVAAAGPVSIGRFADVAKLDVALLEVETSNDAGKALPTAVSSGPLASVNGGTKNVVVIGYPAKPSLEGATDPATGQVSTDIWDRLWELFQNDYGMKYLSPGEVALGPGEIAGDMRRWALSHDATTLGGNSGAPVISLDVPFAVGGLHFGGQPLRQNLAHDLFAVGAAVKSEPRLMKLAAFGGFL